MATETPPNSDNETPVDQEEKPKTEFQEELKKAKKAFAGWSLEYLAENAPKLPPPTNKAE